MICKAMYACLDTKVGIEYFTQPNDEYSEHGKENGYQKLVNLLQQNPLTRVKFALKSILKKVHLFESLQVVRDVISRHLVTVTKVENDEENKIDLLNDQKLLKNCLTEAWSAYTWDAQNYSQPKRFLPISTKFENVVDSNASKAASNSTIRYFRTHGLLESLLVIISNSSSIFVSEEVFDVCLLMLEALCRTANGLEYMSENVDVTNVIVRSLLQASVRAEEAEIGDEELETTGAGPIEDCIDIVEDTRMHKLGTEIAYKVLSNAMH